MNHIHLPVGVSDYSADMAVGPGFIEGPENEITCPGMLQFMSKTVPAPKAE